MEGDGSRQGRHRRRRHALPALRRAVAGAGGTARLGVPLSRLRCRARPSAPRRAAPDARARDVRLGVPAAAGIVVGAGRRELDVVAELHEDAFPDLDVLRSAVEEMRGWGFRLAVADLSGERHVTGTFAWLEPEYVELDVRVPGAVVAPASRAWVAAAHDAGAVLMAATQAREAAPPQRRVRARRARRTPGSARRTSRSPCRSPDRSATASLKPQPRICSTTVRSRPGRERVLVQPGHYASRGARAPTTISRAGRRAEGLGLGRQVTPGDRWSRATSKRGSGTPSRAVYQPQRLGVLQQGRVSATAVRPCRGPSPSSRWSRRGRAGRSAGSPDPAAPGQRSALRWALRLRRVRSISSVRLTPSTFGTLGRRLSPRGAVSVGRDWENRSLHQTT